MNKKEKNEAIYKRVTDKIVGLLDSGTVPWNKPWNPSTECPMNLISKKAYKGINIWLLLYSPYESRFWVTYKQAKDLGGNVKKGEKGTKLIKVNKFLVKNKDEEEEGEETDTGFVVTSINEFTVFNVEQCEGFEYPANDSEKLDFNSIESAEDIIDAMPVKPLILHEKQDKAYYVPVLDKVVMPEATQFKTREHYYHTLFHELGHSTGHEIRCKRKEIMKPNFFGSHDYSREELVAEFCSSFICAVAGIDKEQCVENSAAYIQGWSRKLKDNPSWLAIACGQATKAANYILNIKEEDYADSKEA